jgi:hypothetical protein
MASRRRYLRNYEFRGGMVYPCWRMSNASGAAMARPALPVRPINIRVAGRNPGCRAQSWLPGAIAASPILQKE